MKKPLLFNFLLLVSISFAQIKTNLSQDNIMIGDTVNLYIEVSVPNSGTVELPQVTDSLGKYIEVVAQKIDTLKEGNAIKYTQKLTLTSFEIGDFIIKALPIKINKDTLLSDTKELRVLEMKVEPSLDKMYPIKPILPEHLTWWDRNKKYLWYMVVGGLIILAILVIVWLYIRELKRKRYISTPLLPPYEEAMENLKKLDKKEYLLKKNYNAFYTDLSFILRRYFSRRFEFPAQALLSSDLPQIMEKREYLTTEEAQELSMFLNDSDQVKYAKLNLVEEKHQPYRVWVEKIIEKTRPIIEEVKDHI